MRSVSDRFGAALRRPHRMTTEVDVLFDGEVVVEGLAVAGGSVSYDRTAQVLARLSVTLAEPLRVPNGPGDVLAPYGYELRVRRGVVFPDDTDELVGLGVFPIQRSSVDGVSLATDIDALDRSQLVRDARFEDAYQVASGTNYATALQALIDDGVDGLSYAFASTGYTTPLLTFEAGADRWEAAQQMASSIGCWLYFDGDGRCVLKPEPSLAVEDAVWSFDEGADGVLVSADLELDREPAYNKVIVWSTNADLDDVYRGEAEDSDPGSPTYYDGPFGRKPLFFPTPLVASDAQATAAAEGRLRSVLGVARSLRLEAVTNPALEPGDVVRGTRSTLGLDDVFIIDQMTIGLGPEDPMTVASRSRQEG